MSQKQEKTPEATCVFKVGKAKALHTRTRTSLHILHFGPLFRLYLALDLLTSRREFQRVRCVVQLEIVGEWHTLHDMQSICQQQNAFVYVSVSQTCTHVARLVFNVV